MSDFNFSYVTNNYDKALLHFKRYKCLKTACIYCVQQYTIRDKHQLISNDKNALICFKCNVDCAVPIIPRSILYNLQDDVINEKIKSWNEYCFSKIEDSNDY